MVKSLHLFTVIHVDRFSTVRQELEERVNVTDADAIVIEYPREKLTFSKWFSEFIKQPLVVTGNSIYSLVSFMMYAITSRTVLPSELRAVRELTDNRSVPVHNIDHHTNTPFSDSWLQSIFLNWGVIFVVAFLFDPLRITFTFMLANFIYWSILGVAYFSQRLAAFLAIPAFILFFFAQVQLGSFVILLLSGIGFLLMLSLTMDDRNAEMLEEIQDVTRSNGYDSVVFVTGSDHLTGIQALVRNFSDLEIKSIWERRFFRKGVQKDNPNNVKS